MLGCPGGKSGRPEIWARDKALGGITVWKAAETKGTKENANRVVILKGAVDAWETLSLRRCNHGSPFCLLGHLHHPQLASLVAQMVENLPSVQETRVQSLGQDDALKKGMATHFSILAWEIPWTEKPGGLQSVGSQRVTHKWVHTHTTLVCVYVTFVCTHTHTHTYFHFKSDITLKW